MTDQKQLCAAYIYLLLLIYLFELYLHCCGFKTISWSLCLVLAALNSPSLVAVCRFHMASQTAHTSF